MDTKRVVIVDDEFAARQLLSEVVTSFPQLEIVAEFRDGRSAIEGIPALKPDIVFLDIEMPEMDGFAVAKATQDHYYQLVFVTAFERYALDAFDTRAISYLLKPARPAMIERCIHKILQQENRLQHKVSPQRTPPQSLTIAENNTVRVIAWEHICFIEGIGRYRRMHLTPAGQLIHRTETLLSDITLNDFETQLPVADFMRCHRSYIVSLQQVSRLYMRSRRYYLSINHHASPLPVARSKVRELRSRLFISAQTEYR